jgi:hypothetical protein
MTDPGARLPDPRMIPRWTAPASRPPAAQDETTLTDPPAVASVDAAIWPEFPLYGGQFDEVVPHLTIGDLTNGDDEAALRQVEDDLVDTLPLRTQASALWWMAQDQGRHWTRQLTFTLDT